MDEFLNLDLIMGWGLSEKSIAHIFEKDKGLAALEDVQTHPNSDINQLANDILVVYFEGVD